MISEQLMQTTKQWLPLMLVICLSPACAVYESWPGGSRSETSQAPAPVIREKAPIQTESSVPPGVEESSAKQTAPTTDVQPERTAAVAQPTGPAGFLLEEAARHRRAGKLAAAAKSVERAMRIQPGNPWLSLELAEIRLEQGNSSQAELLAQRALAQAGGDRRLQAQCWRMTAAAREASGDAAGAAAALSKASE